MFVLAHLSDPHLHPVSRPHLRELASKRVLGFINWQTRRHRRHDMDALAALVADLKVESPDHVALTGDLAVVGAQAEYLPARAFLASLGGPDWVSVVPGNHDSYVRATWHHPLLHWSDYMRGDAVEDRGLPHFPYVRRRGPLAIVGLSTAVPTAPFSATGRLGRGQAARLRRTLLALAGEERFRVVLIHHPPIAGGHYLRRLVDAEAVASAIAEAGAELVLHGHEHRPVVAALPGPNGPVPVIGVPSASAGPNDPTAPGAYNLYAIERVGGAWRCTVTTRGFAPGGSTIAERSRRELVPA
ncbi:MAG TPA: metallophosphoesterase [Hyphomicrobiales bacterium]|nr:metallophosphoesterase [Hyphomicrobiales bacterium]